MTLPTLNDYTKALLMHNSAAMTATAPPVSKRTGVVLREGRAVRDDQGLFHPLGLTFFWSMQGWKYEREHFTSNAAWVAKKRIDYVRMLTEVGWDGREIDPSSPEWADWGPVLREVMDHWRSLGVRCELTLIGKGTNTDPVWLAQQVGDIIAENRQDCVVDVECANEYSIYDGPTIEVMSKMARALQARIPNVIALSNPGDEGEAEELLVKAKQLGIAGYTLHLDRGPGDYKWRQVRQSYDMKNSRPLVSFSNEPVGPASSVSQNDNPLQLAMLRAVGVMCGGAGFVLHTGTGVFGDGKGHPTAGPRPPNFWEIQNIDAIVDALRNIDVLLPEGVENWQVANTQWTPPNPVTPFQPHNHWEGPEGDGVNKAYGALAPDGRVIQMPIGVRGHVTLRASYPLHEVTVYDPLTLQPVQGIANQSFAQGQTMDLPGGGQDAMVAYIIHGRRG